MTQITTKMRSLLQDLPTATLLLAGTRVEQVPRDTLFKAFLTDEDHEAIKRAKSIVHLENESTTQVWFDLPHLTYPMVVSPVMRDGRVRFVGQSPYWPTAAVIKDYDAFAELHQHATDIAQLRFERGIFFYIYRQCLDAATSLGQLYHAFPPVLGLLKEKQEPELVGKIVAAQGKRPIPIAIPAHLRPIVRHCLTWYATHQLAETFEHVATMPKHIVMRMQTTELTQVTFESNPEQPATISY